MNRTERTATRRREFHLTRVSANTPRQRLAGAVQWMTAEAIHQGPEVVRRVTDQVLAIVDQLTKGQGSDGQ